ncbi:hypothetical protein JX266_014148 [Neoarthrinium moseri]|nr:hypothetical protein JX266_014148 [Neoarthrinium moseri]
MDRLNNNEREAVQTLLALHSRSMQPSQLDVDERQAREGQQQSIRAGNGMQLQLRRSRWLAITFIYHVILQRPSTTHLRGLNLTQHLEDTQFEALISSLAVPADVFTFFLSVEGPGFKGREEISLLADKNYQERRWRSAVAYLAQMPEKVSKLDWQGQDDTMVYEVNFELIGHDEDSGKTCGEEFEFTI